MAAADVLSAPRVQCSDGTVRDLFRGDLASVSDALKRSAETTWDGLLATVSPTVLPYLEYRLLAAGAMAAIPRDAQRTLSSARDAAILAELQRRSVLKAALSCLAAHGIETVLLKGAALAVSLYPAPHLRPMSDIDIWVADQQLAEGVRGLLENGFEVPAGELPGGRVSWTLGQRRLRASGAGLLLELHGSVHSLESLSTDRIERVWARSLPVRAHGSRTRVLCPEDALLHACLHLATTNRFANSQLSLLDVSLIADKWGAEIDWIGLARDCRRQQVAVYVTLALRVAHHVWGAPVPGEYFAAIGEVQGLAEMEALALGQVWARNHRLPSALERVLREPTGAARFAAVCHRVFAHAGPSDGETRHPWHLARQVGSRVVNDLTVKLPHYVRAWARGDLARRELGHRAGLAADRGRIGILADQAEARLRNE